MLKGRERNDREKAFVEVTLITTRFETSEYRYFGGINLSTADFWLN